MKRILFVHHVSSIGGGSYCLLNLLKTIDRNKFEPIVLLRNYGPLVDELEKLDIRVVYLSSLNQIPYNGSLFKVRNIILYIKVFLSLFSFKKLLVREKIDIVYLNNMMIIPYLIPAKKVNCKTAVHVREHWPLNEHIKQLRWLRNIVYKYCDSLVAINKYSASIFPQKKSTIIYDWIDMSERFKPISMDKIFGEDCSDKKILLYTGGFSSIKGIEYVLKAFATLKEEEYRLLILGENTIFCGYKHTIKNIIKKIIGRRNLAKEMQKILDSDYRIKCIPPIYELTDLIEKSHCFVSYFAIPHANLSLAENIILGNPCIVADNEEAKEYTNNGEYAMLVSPNNQIEFNNKLKEFLLNIDYWKAQSSKGVIPISKMFDKEINVSKFRNICDYFVE
ncbi:MAG: glycosyltransferase family 4 protein [Bacteroidales bacterium]|nr:glycosyltransferase family 4 protein [Bacteroidales bacterium]